MLGARDLFTGALYQWQYLVLSVKCEQRARLKYRRPHAIVAAIELRSAENAQNFFELAGVERGTCFVQLGGSWGKGGSTTRAWHGMSLSRHAALASLKTRARA